MEKAFGFFLILLGLILIFFYTANPDGVIHSFSLFLPPWAVFVTSFVIVIIGAFMMASKPKYPR